MYTSKMDWPRPPSPPPTTSPSFDFGQQSLGMPITASSVVVTPRPETPAGSRMGIAIPPHPGRAGVSPPTPAPSPTPADKYFGRMSMRSLEQALGSDEELERATMARRDWQLTTASAGMEGGDLSIDVMPQGIDEMITSFRHLGKSQRFAFLAQLVQELQLPEALVISRKVAPRLKRDFLKELPMELALHCLSFVEDARTLARAAQVSRYWFTLLQDEQTWKEMCERNRFLPLRSPLLAHSSQSRNARWPQIDHALRAGVPSPQYPSFLPGPGSWRMPPAAPTATFKQKFKDAYLTESNWLSAGRQIAYHKHSDNGVVTSLAINDAFIVVGMANHQIEVYDANTGAFRRRLEGHEAGVWALVLVTPSKGQRPQMPRATANNTRSSAAGPDFVAYSRTARSGNYRDNGQSRRASFNGPTSQHFASNGAPTQGNRGRGESSVTRPSTAIGFEPLPRAGTLGNRIPMTDACGSARGDWSKRHLVVSGGCDREVRVWDARTGQCLHAMRGHTSTIRCLKVLDNRPIAVTGSRDWTLRVWDIENGECLHVLQGHQQSVRCIDVAGNLIASGSYDFSCRVWNADTGECLRVLMGHYHQIYAVAFDGQRVVTGSLDSTVRVWDANTGHCTAMLQGHTCLVGQLQLSGDTLVTGGSDGRVIIFDLPPQPRTSPTLSPFPLSPNAQPYISTSAPMTSYMSVPANSLSSSASSSQLIPRAGGTTATSAVTSAYHSGAAAICLHRLCAHDNSVTCLQFDDRFIISGGNDGRVKLWDLRTGGFIRELTRPCEAIWRINFKDDKCVILCQRNGRTVLEVLSFKPGEIGGRRILT